MLTKLFSIEELIHLFPSLFAILLCGISKFDHYWIDAKVEGQLSRGAKPQPGKIVEAQQFANGAATLNIHLVNVLLFVAGAILAVFDWPSCQVAWPLITCVLLFALVLYDLFVTAICTQLSMFDREPITKSISRIGPWRWFRNLAPSARLRWEQIAFNVVIVALVVIGVGLGGTENSVGICKADDHLSIASKSTEPKEHVSNAPGATEPKKSIPVAAGPGPDGFFQP